MGRFLCPYNYAKCEISSYVFVVGCLGITALIVSELGAFLYCFLFFIDYCYRFSMFVNLFMSKSNQLLYCSLLQFVYCSPAHLHLALERVSSTPALIDNKPKSERRPPPPLPLTPRASIKNAWGHSSDQEDGVLPEFL